MEGDYGIVVRVLDSNPPPLPLDEFVFSGPEFKFSVPTGQPPTVGVFNTLQCTQPLSLCACYHTTPLHVHRYYPLYSSRKYPFPPHGGSMEIPRWLGVSKGKYGLNWKFQRGRGIYTKNLPWEGYGYFLEQYIG